MRDQRSVVLVFPRNVTGWQAQPWCDLPLGLLTVATPLHQAGYRVRIIDQRVSPDWQALLEAELERSPLCVGLSSMTGPQLHHALEVSRLVKRRDRIPVVWGGVHPSLLPEQTLENEYVDYVVQGEGEEAFLELVQALEQGRPPVDVPGVWHKRNGAPAFGGPRPFVDLNAQPELAYDLVDVPKYTRTVFGVKRLSFASSRGCTYPCAFCYNTVFHQRRWRALDAGIAVRQIKNLVNRYSVRGLFLTDANFFLDLDRARTILEDAQREIPGLVFSRLHIRFDSLVRLTDSDFALLERAGCKCLAVGIESGSERIRNLLRKPIDEARLREVNRAMRRYAIVPLYFFMMGFPTETVEELRQTCRLFTTLVQDNPRAAKSVNIYSPYPGTELMELARANGLEPPHSIKDWVSFSYRSLGSGGPWIPERNRRIIEMLDFCAFFVGETSYRRPFKQTHPLVVLLARLYAPVARKRVEAFYTGFPLEIRLARRLGLFAKQA